MSWALEFVAQRTKPKEGWLPLFLLATIVVCLILAVRDADWIPEDGVVIPAATLGLLLGVVLAKRPLSAWAAWILITLYGALIPFIYLGNLWPTWAALSAGWEGLRPYWLQNGALLLDRTWSWGTAVFAGESSQETIVFALGLSLASYFLAAFASWELFRHYRPFTGLLLMGLGLALNSYFGQAEIWWLGAFVGLTALLTATMHFTALAKSWDTHQVDYSNEVQADLLLYATGIATVLLALALTLPTFSIRRLVRSFQQQPAVQQAEAALERAFAGVESSSGQPSGPDGVGSRGVLPRAFLLGNAPELYETVVMTAVVQSEANLTGIHWRALSYDVYTGSGWALSEERTETIPANTIIPLPEVENTAVVSQTVHWLQDERLTRYTLGLPQQLDQDVESIWRGQTDFVRVQSEETIYSVQSQISLATQEQLRETAVTDIPPALLARYTALPDELPQRVRDLAQDVAGTRSNPYDQAVALERFLRQYEYSLDLSAPPRDADPVEYFLFEQQMGYCDFYASAMVVLARSLGLPARLGIGFLAQPADENGGQIIYQINGHSWAEIYFAGYGWIEFEPTATFTTPHTNRFNPAGPPEFVNELPEITEVAPPLPEAETPQPFPWSLFCSGSFLALFAWWLWQRSQFPAGQDVVVWSYGRLQQQATKLGQPPAPSQTPQEFLTTFQHHLAGYGRFARLAKRIEQMRPHLTQLMQLYVQRKYANEPKAGSMIAWQSWQQLKRPLWFLCIVRRVAKKNP